VKGRRREPWALQQLAALGREAKRRWLELRQSGLDLSCAGDAVALLDPEFRLPPDLEERIQEALPGIEGRVAVRFLKWVMCAKTQEDENPFEPLLEILEHGGSFYVEHGMFLDIYSDQGAKCSIVLIR
jgi:hypothetical protein